MTLLRNDLSRNIEIPKFFKVETNPMFVGEAFEKIYKNEDDEIYFQPTSMVILITLNALYESGDESSISICLPWKLVVQMISMYNGTWENKKKINDFDRNCNYR